MATRNARQTDSSCNRRCAMTSRRRGERRWQPGWTRRPSLASAVSRRADEPMVAKQFSCQNETTHAHSSKNNDCWNNSRLRDDGTRFGFPTSENLDADPFSMINFGDLDVFGILYLFIYHFFPIYHTWFNFGCFFLILYYHVMVK